MTAQVAPYRLVALTFFFAALCGALGVVVQRHSYGDVQGAVTGGILGAVTGAVLAALCDLRRARQEREAAAAAAPIDVPWPLTPELARRAFHEPEGDWAWRRADATAVVARLLASGHAIVGGEVWWLKPDGRTWLAAVPDRSGREGLWTWSADREPGEEWKAFVQRAADAAKQHVAEWPDLEDLPAGLQGEPVYHFTWTAARGKVRAARQ